MGFNEKKKRKKRKTEYASEKCLLIVSFIM